jgi:SAM-dependent methyltransferase
VGGLFGVSGDRAVLRTLTFEHADGSVSPLRSEVLCERSGVDKRSARRGEYGIDAPYVPLMLATGGLGLAGFALVVGSLAALSGGIGMLLGAASYLYTTRSGKFAVWEGILDELQLRGDERILDIGCGRGAVLLLAAKRLSRGQAVGVDLWSTTDQSGNRSEATLRNAELEGVAARVELQTADMRELPFEDASFDVVVSTLQAADARSSKRLAC